MRPQPAVDRSPQPAREPWWSSPMAACAALVVLALAVYAPTLTHQFVYDDRVLIEQNPLIAHVGDIPRLFLTDLWGGIGESPRRGDQDGETGMSVHRRYRPLAMTSLTLNYAAGANNPFGYHLVNILLHAAASALLYLVARELGWSHGGAFIGAVLFAVHPLHSEAVAWIVGRPEMMMTIGVLSALWLAQRGRQGAAVCAFLFGVCSKEQAVMFPALLLLADLCRGGIVWSGAEGRRMLIRRYAPYGAALALYMGLRTLAVGGFRPEPYPFLENPLEHLEGPAWLLAVVNMAGYYLRLAIWPQPLTVDYSFGTLPLPATPVDPGVLWSLASWGGLLALGLWGWRQDRRVTFAVGLTALTFAPVANVMVPVGTPVAERLFYLPLGGLCWLLGTAWERLSGIGQARAFIRRAAWVGAAALAVVLTMRTVVRLQDWRTSESLFRTAVAAAPDNPKAHYLLGSELAARGERAALEEGVRELEKAVALYPDYPATDALLANNLGVGRLHLGRYAEAVAPLEQAIAQRPRWSNPYYQLGLVYGKLEQPAKAVDLWRRALALAPDNMAVRLRLMRLLIQQNRFAEGLQEADAAIARDPGYASAHFHRGWALQELGRLGEAQAAYEQVLRMPDASPTAREAATRRLQELHATDTINAIITLP